MDEKEAFENLLNKEKQKDWEKILDSIIENKIVIILPLPLETITVIIEENPKLFFKLMAAFPGQAGKIAKILKAVLSKNN